MQNQNKKLRQSYQELQESVGQLKQEVMGLRQVLSGYAEVLSAIVSLLGESSVQDEMARMRQEQQERQEQQMAAGVAMLVDAGILKPVAETSVDTLVVGTDLTPDGKTRRVKFELKANVVPEDVLPKFLGKKPGDVIENNGVKMTLIEVYSVDRARAAEWQAEQQKKAQEAAQQAQPNVPVVEEAAPATPAPELEDLQAGVADPDPAPEAETTPEDDGSES